jgi:uncharacterized protein YodC (DUF2158 family)
MSSESNFNVGDVVILRSGSPAMTVHGVGDYGPLHPSPGVLCVWFQGQKKYEEVFDPKALATHKPDA